MLDIKHSCKVWLLLGMLWQPLSFLFSVPHLLPFADLGLQLPVLHGGDLLQIPARLQASAGCRGGDCSGKEDKVKSCTVKVTALEL